MHMRVLMLGWFGDRENSGGMEVHIREICKNMENTSILLAAPKNSKLKNIGKNVQILKIPCKTRAKSLENMAKDVFRFNKNIIESLKNRPGDFGIIHSHDWLPVPAAKELRKRFKKPWVHTVHSLEHIRAGEETSSEISRIEKEGIILSDKIITVSDLMKNEIIEKYKVPHGKISVIRNYLGAGAHENTPPKKTKSGKTVLYAGRLSLQKGVDTLIAAFPEVLRVHPDARLIIAGDGSLKKSLVAFSKISGIEKSSVFCGHVGEKALHELYGRASVFVSPSVFEPFGITVLEAVYYGAPVIATKYTGALEIFSKNSAIAVIPGNRHMLAKNIIAIIGSSDGGMKMAGRAKNDLKKADGWKIISEKTERVYRALSD